MSDLLGLPLVALPAGRGILAEDGPQTPTSVPQQLLSRLKWVEALEACLNRDAFNSIDRLQQLHPRKNVNDA